MNAGRRRAWVAWVGLLLLGALVTVAATAYAASLTVTSGRLTQRTLAPPCVPAWWDSAYGYRVPLSVTTVSPIGTDYSLPTVLDHAGLVAAGTSLASGDDVRVVALDSGTCTWTQLDRVLDDSSVWNASSTRIWFRSTAVITADSSSPQAFFVYYGNPSAGAPPANGGNVFLAHDRFPGTGLGASWQVLRSPASWSVGAGSLTITMGKNKDFLGPGGNAPLFSLTAPSGDLEIQVRQSGALTGDGQTGGILAYADDDNYLANYHERFAGGVKGTDFVREVAGSATTQKNSSGTATADPIWLRLTKTGSSYVASHSTDGGVSYSDQGTYATTTLNRIGLSAFSTTSSTTTISFTSFRVRRLVTTAPTVTVGTQTAKY